MEEVEMYRKTDSFRVTDDAGKVWAVHVFTCFVRTDNSEGAGEVATTSQYRLADGRLLNCIGEGEYQVLDPLKPVILRRLKLPVG
jgi:hypothetical protein